MDADLAGFRDAQVLLRAKLGRDVPFFTPSATTYPPGTALDPESGQPYDPTILPTASGFASAAVRATVVMPGATPIRDDVVMNALGEIEVGEAALVVGAEEYDTNNLEAATKVELYGEEYEITQQNLDSIGDGPPHRAILRVRKA